MARQTPPHLAHGAWGPSPWLWPWFQHPPGARGDAGGPRSPKPPAPAAAQKPLPSCLRAPSAHTGELTALKVHFSGCEPLRWLGPFLRASLFSRPFSGRESGASLPSSCKSLPMPNTHGFSFQNVPSGSFSLLPASANPWVRATQRLVTEVSRGASEKRRLRARTCGMRPASVQPAGSLLCPSASERRGPPSPPCPGVPTLALNTPPASLPPGPHASVGSLPRPCTCMPDALGSLARPFF